jgi:hypothetical protein
LSPKNREIILRYIATPYLHGTEKTLRDISTLSSIIPRQEDQLGAASASAFTALSFALDIFPSLRDCLTAGGEYEFCGKLWKAVGERSRIKAWYDGENVRARAWTLSEYGTAEWIASEGEKYGKDEM